MTISVKVVKDDGQEVETTVNSVEEAKAWLDESTKPAEEAKKEEETAKEEGAAGEGTGSEAAA